MTGRLFLDEDPTSRHERARATGSAIVADGRLPGLVAPLLLRARGPLGVATFDLRFEAADGGAALLVPLSEEDEPDSNQLRLERAHAGWTNSRDLARAQLDDAVREARTIVADTGVEVEAGGILPSPTWRVTQPTPVLLVSARGADTRMQRIRLDAPTAHGLRASLLQIAATHQLAIPVAAKWAAAGAVGAVDKVAHAIMEESGIALGDVVWALERRRKVEFRCAGSQGAGWFQWRDFVIVAETEGRGGLRLDGNSLIIAQHGTSETLMLACRGKALSQVVAQDFLPKELVVEDVQASPTGDLLINLSSCQLYFGSDMVVGRP